MEKVKMGRPTTPNHNKKTHRYSRIEKEFSKILNEMKDEESKKMVIEVLEILKK